MKQEHETRLAEYRELIEKELEQALHGTESTVGDAMRYSTLGGGKRIRGVLALEFCRVFGGTPSKAGCAAAAVEMIHAFSLIHDDLPCMDDDDERRGKPSCHKQFSEATALLAGDALLANSFNTAAATAFLPKSVGLKPQNSVSIVSTLSNAAMEMIKGQQLDMDYEIRLEKITEDDIIGMYNRKTCALISAACVCGAICADASDKRIHTARAYGVALGLAFQLADDLLDFKTEKSGKKTYATLFGEKKTKSKAREYTDMAVKIAEKISGGEFLLELAVQLNKREI
jgi:geranylgeranyl diphosphate synthase type II